MDIGKVLRFAWHLDGKIAGSARPGRYGVLDRDLAFVRAQGIRHIINLCEDPLELPAAHRDHLCVHHVPVLDGHPPTDHDMEQVRASVQRAMAQNQPVLIHCMGGVGRTATVIAVLLMELGDLSLEESLDNLRQVGRFTQSMTQYEFLKKFAHR